MKFQEKTSQNLTEATGTECTLNLITVIMIHFCNKWVIAKFKRLTETRTRPLRVARILKDLIFRPFTVRQARAEPRFLILFPSLPRAPSPPALPAPHLRRRQWLVILKQTEDRTVCAPFERALKDIVFASEGPWRAAGKAHGPKPSRNTSPSWLKPRSWQSVSLT